jgi:hypothetical protein
LGGVVEGRPTTEDNINLRRHKNACRYYREKWFLEEDERYSQLGEVLYRVYCLRGTPPATAEEQEKCFKRRSRCWRECAGQEEYCEEEAEARCD